MSAPNSQAEMLFMSKVERHLDRIATALEQMNKRQEEFMTGFMTGYIKEKREKGDKAEEHPT